MTFKSLTLVSPAKINLFLNVIRRRPDGFHDIESLFERISLFDTITLVRIDRPVIRLSVGKADIPVDASNLAWKAADLMRKEYGVREGVFIKIKKRIPVSAGLGGGSSNAATVLLGLNRLWNLRKSKKELLRLGATLGSDVPFFLLGQKFALAKGRGEILKPFPVKNLKIWHCLVKPPFGYSTREAYEALDPSTLTPHSPDAKMLIHSIRKGDSQALSLLLTNSLEDTLNKRVMTILKIKRDLVKQGALASLMTGSGSAVFGVFLSQKKAEKATDVLKRENKSWQVFSAGTY